MENSISLQTILSDWRTWVVMGMGAACAIFVYWWVNRLEARRLLMIRAAAGEPGSAAAEPPLQQPAWVVRDPFVHGSANEKRNSLRRKGNAVTVLVSDAKAEAPPERGSVLDRSQGGLRLAVSQETQPGTVLSVRAAHAATIVPWVQLEVRTCTRSDVGWELGCQYVKAPPSSVQWLFG